MEQYFDILMQNHLFNNIQKTDLFFVLKCLQAKISDFKKGELIFLNGSKINYIGLILLGNVQIIKEDFNGNQTIISLLKQGDLFGESYACTGLSIINATVLASSDCKILFIDYNKIINVCSSNCSFHTKLIENMIKILAYKNIILNQKIDFMSKRTIREKLIAYFGGEMQKAKSKKFIVEYKRQELADFLCIDRSALSRELCNMRDEGLIKFNKNEFEVMT